MRPILLLLACLTLPAQERAILPVSSPAVKALVIGINNYPRLGASANLRNSVNDAADFADMLEKQAGVPRANITLLTTNPAHPLITLEDLKNAVEGFYRRLRPGDTAIFFYSGHGVQVENDPSPNFLVPSDLDLDVLEVDLKKRAYPLSRVIELMEGKKAGLRLLFVDACRNNPFIEEQRRGRGLGDQPVDTYRPPQNVGIGTVIGYAVSPGQKALDRSPNGRNGMYTYYLLRNLPKPGVDVIDAMRALAREVYRDSGQTMTPSFYGNILDPVSLVGGVRRVEAEPVRGKRVNPKDGLTYVWIPPGSFMMGCSPGDTECYDDEKPAKRVNIAKGFWLGESEVTQAAYQKVTGKNPSYRKGPERPVEEVDWNESMSYCRAIGGRLPTEAEWEYAARAGTTGARYGELDRIAWTNANSGGNTHDVKQKEPNAWGLYDMLGNVWEWTEEQTLRGGSWLYVTGFSRVSDRDRCGPTGRNVQSRLSVYRGIASLYSFPFSLSPPSRDGGVRMSARRSREFFWPPHST
jgi:hypothetical protein